MYFENQAKSLKTKVNDMNNRIVIALAAVLLSVPVHADEQVDRTIDVDPKSEIEIFNTAGSIEVSGWDRSAVQVTGTLGDAVEELILERDGNEVLVRVEAPRRHRGDISASLVIRVPEKSSAEISGVSTDIDISGVLGELSLESVSGDIDARGVGADVEAESVSGDIGIQGEGTEGDFEAASVSGDITIVNLSGRVHAESVSGDVDVEGGTFEEVHFETVNGDLTFKGSLASAGELSAESVNGSVDIEFVELVTSARIDIETFNGSIRNCFGPKPQRTSKYSPGLELSFVIGEGDADIEVETLNGSVSLCNSE